MKNKMRYLVGAVVGMGIYALCEKYTPNMMEDMKNMVTNVKKDATEKVEKMVQ